MPTIHQSIRGATVGRRGRILQYADGGTYVQDASGVKLEGNQEVVQWTVTGPHTLRSSHFWFYAFWALLALVVTLWFIGQ